MKKKKIVVRKWILSLLIVLKIEDDEKQTNIVVEKQIKV